MQKVINKGQIDEMKGRKDERKEDKRKGVREERREAKRKEGGRKR